MSKKWKILCAIFMILLIIVLTFALLYVDGRNKLNKAIYKIKAAGLATSKEELYKKYVKENAENPKAMSLILDIINNEVQPENDKSLIIIGLGGTPKLDERISDSGIKLIGETVKANKDYFEQLAQLENYKSLTCKNLYDTDNFTVSRGLHISTQMMLLKVEQALAEKQTANVFKSLQSMMHITCLSAQTPGNLSHMITYGLISYHVGCIKRCLNMTKFNNEQLLIIENNCDILDSLIRNKWSSLCEYEISVLISNSNFSKQYSTINVIHSEKTSFEKIISYIEFYYKYYSGNTFRNIAQNLNILRKLSLSELRSYPQITAIFPKPIQNIRELSFSLNIADKALSLIAQLRCAKIACAIERYYLKNGKRPNKLDQLVPEFMSRLPLDPYNNEPFEYYKGNMNIEYPERLDHQPFIPTQNNTQKQGYYLCSRGKDLKFEKKTSIHPYFRYKDKDIIFIVITQQ